MIDYINIGCTPSGESCAQVGTENYMERSRKECKRFIELLRKKFGTEPKGAELGIKSFPHDFGTYIEVVCYFDPANAKAAEYALRCESETPETWDECEEEKHERCQT